MRTRFPPSIAARAVPCLAAALAAAAGCSDSFELPQSIPTGILTVVARSEGGQYVLTPEGVFLESTGMLTADSRSTVDTCQVGDLPTGGTAPNLDHLDAGDSIAFDLEGVTRYMKPVEQFGIITYVLSDPDVEFAPGDAFSFDLEGGPGFPAATIGSALAPVLTTLTPIPASPPTDQPLVVSWTPVGDAGSRLEISLQYALEGSVQPDEHILCAWRDDGAGEIRGELLTGWAASGLRRIAVTRYRTERLEIGERVLFLLVTFDSVPPVQ
jgi:hypothetical protein